MNSLNSVNPPIIYLISHSIEMCQADLNIVTVGDKDFCNIKCLNVSVDMFTMALIKYTSK